MSISHVDRWFSFTSPPASALLLLVVGSLLLWNVPSHAQERPASPVLTAPTDSDAASSTAKATLSGYTTVSSTGQIGGRTWPSNEVNFFPNGTPVPAGDVNDDGRADWIFQEGSVADDRTSDLSDRTAKTLLRFGGDNFGTAYSDVVHYAALEPVGQLTGTPGTDALMIDAPAGEVEIWTGSSTGYTNTGSRLSISLSNFDIYGSADLNDDGYDDVLIANPTSTTLLVLYGGAQISDLLVQTYSLPAIEEASFAFAVGNTDSDAPAELVRIEGGESGNDPSYTVTVYGVDPNTSTQLLEEQSFTTTAFTSGFASRLTSVSIAEVTDGGLADIVVRDGAITRVFQSFQGETSYAPSPAAYGDARLLGDLNGDGASDFFVRDTNAAPFIAFGGGNSVSPDLALPTDGGADSLRVARSGQRLGDVTGDGRDDVILNRRGPSTFGPALASVPASSVSLTTFDFDNSAYTSTPIFRAVSAGTWDSDADPDIVALRDAYRIREDVEGGSVELYLGDPTASPTPDLTFTHPNGARPADAVAADVTGNGRMNLIVAWQAAAPTVTIYEEGSGTTPIHSVDFADLESGIGTTQVGVYVETVAAVDLTGDGVGDWVLGAPQSNTGQNVYFYTGGPSLSTTPDQIVRNGTAPGGDGSSLQVLDDINDDGAPDLALGALQSEQINVYFGTDAGTALDLSTADVTVPLSPASGENLTFFPLGMTAGDFTGDGITDLAAKPFFFQTSDGSEGIEAIRIYHGGPGFDGTPDEKLFIPGPPLDIDGDQSGPNYLKQSVGELTRVGDLDLDGSDEFLVGSASSFTTNALVYAGNGSARPAPISALDAPDGNWGLGVNNNNLFNNNGSSAIGDFNGDGRIEALLPQDFNPNFISPPLFVYAFEAASVASGVADATISTDGSGGGSADLPESDVGVNNVDFSGASGSGSVQATYFDNAPSNTDGIAESTTSAYRVILETEGSFSFSSATIRFSLDNLGGINDPNDLTLYKRSPAGSGTFASIPVEDVSIDTNTNELVATVSSFSEFALASNSNPLPVELADWSAALSDGGVTLSWRTLSESGNAGFAVERRTGDDGAWTRIAFVDGAGTTDRAQTYRARDTALPFEADVLTYRLRQVDTDGSETLSKTVRVRRGAPQALTLKPPFPNPVRAQATVQLAIPEGTDDARLVLYDLLGRNVRSVDASRTGRQEITLRTDGLASGVYFLRLTGGGQATTQRVTVVR